MRYLLDTHAFLWFLNDDPKLPPTAREVIRRAESLCISIGSFWEMAIKANKGKLILPAPISEMMRACDEMRIAILPIASTHLECLQGMPAYHADPFDRLIISQAIVENCAILSADSAFDRYDVHIIWN